MKKGDLIHGFTVVSDEYIKEAEAHLYTFSHESGARLAFLEREDENKTFSIAFPTPPEDDTGVFHIIEHSTLCGSEKFPAKEPFVELLKGSLNTFLNAMTYEDRTVYPVSSRCDKDFYNLTSVYLDAVFHPLMRKNPFIFEQEGRRYEYDEKTNTLSYNGVVYNEMKGAYSSPDELGYSEISRLLYEGSSYGRDSGGDPDFIPELEYEDFCRLHEKYYHPKNAYIYLDGSVDLDSVMPLIDSYLSGFEKREDTVTLSVKTEPKKKYSEVKFEVSDRDEGAKARLILGYPFSNFSQTDEKLLSAVLISHLAENNESPLPKALLEGGLCEDVIVNANYSNTFTLTVEIKGIDPKNKSRILEIYNSVIEQECRGMDRESLHANLNRTEFKLRERELGSFPVGVANALSVYELWCYGGKPSQGLVFEEDIEKIRKGIDTGYAEALLIKAVRDNPASAEVLMLPDKNIAKERENALSVKLSEKLASFTKEELEKIIDNQRKFTLWQKSEDTPEVLAALPSLALCDIEVKDHSVETERLSLSGADVIRHKINTRGISYLTLFFDGEDLCEKEISLLPLLASALTNLDTRNYSVSELNKQIKSDLGTLSAHASVISNSKKGFTKPVIRINSSSLDGKRDTMVRLVREILCLTEFENTEAVKKLLTQTVSGLEDLFASNGEAVAMSRVEAMSTPHGRISELLHGYDCYVNSKGFLKSIEKDPEEFMKELKELSHKLFVKERLIISSASENPDFDKDIINSLENGSASAKKKTEPLPVLREGISIPSRVGYACLGGNLPETKELMGTLRVARSILSYEYLWNNIRVKGGAYGAGFVPRKDGGLYFYSYRDPSPERSIEIFKSSGKYLRELAKSGQDFTKFIIGAYGEYDIMKTPKTAAAAATANALTDWTASDERKLREGLLGTNKDSLLKAADLLDKLSECSATVVAGSQETLNSFKEKFDKILKI